MRFSRQVYWSGLLFLLQGIFPAQGSKPGLPHCKVDSLPSEPPQKPYISLKLSNNIYLSVQFNSVQSLSRVQLLATPWTAAHQASLSITNSQSPPKPMSIELVMPSNHFILCCPLLLPPSIFPSIRVFSNESALCIRWPKYWSFSFNISPSTSTADKNKESASSSMAGTEDSPTTLIPGPECHRPTSA